MKYNSITIKIDNIAQYKMDENLEESLKNVHWRIQSKNYTELMAVMINGTIKGIGMSWNNSNHPHAKYIHVAGTGKNELIKELLIHTSPYDWIIFSCWENELDKIQQVQQFQFQLFRKTYMEKYVINDLLQKLVEVGETPSLLMPLVQILGDPVLEEDLFRLLKHSYEQTHLHNPAKEMDWQKWKDELLNDLPDLHLSYIAIENNRVTSYIFVHPVDDKHYEIGWVGQRGTLNLLPFLRQQLILLKEKGISSVEFEVDTTDYNAWQFSEVLDLNAKLCWHSYILKSRKSH
ncbi:ATPase with chaperone activity, ATP-binding subunit [Solibacillus silvestris StLB046]|uniref:ATPase with chaperone activity, ATP-binding subunit n=1 Tax=Solibacillus silvestris (strain StLB046) TaxID=1002809 RepID=F2F154_SOLSS|nr:hypothetical protein [Solibacillus silvestris]BAK16849.1 ATPase with chaperone activity, ATP-binding subunit [Solibacillus silvestris StLB046]